MALADAAARSPPPLRRQWMHRRRPRQPSEPPLRLGRRKATEMPLGFM
eukprot:COSAG06_NODE_430_length_15870_cov_101.914971_14_plen_48_part_00